MSQESLKKDIQRVFEYIDKNSNQMISIDEFKTYIKMVNIQLGRYYSDYEAEALFSKMDTNSDKSISFEEFKSNICLKILII